MDSLRHQNVTRYISPMREGGSLPALAEADDGFKYIVKFRGAGHGTKALVAEYIGAMIASRLGLNVPEPVFLDIDERFGMTEPDEEIQDLLKASRGLNFGLHFLEGSLTFDPYANIVDSRLASDIVWLDAFLTNVDRTVKNTNILVWHGKEIWLIDHGASLYFHHSWTGWEKAALSPFPYIKDHALISKAADLEAAHERALGLITPDFINEVVSGLPDSWLSWPEAPGSPDAIRDVYRQFLNIRLQNSEIFLRHAIECRKTLV